MRTLLVLPAVTLPVALATVWFAARQIGEAAHSLQAELVRLTPVAGEARRCRDELRHVRDRLLDPGTHLPRR